MNDFRVLIQSCEEAIRSGKLSQAIAYLTAINTAAVPREFRLPIARLCRRTLLVALGLRLLTPIIYPTQKKFNVIPTPEELAEYAVLLQRQGSNREALAILSQISFRQVPDVLL